MFGRSDKWWLRELEKRDRAHEHQVQDLIRTVAHLAARPLPDPWTPPAPLAEAVQAAEPLEDI